MADKTKKFIKGHNVLKGKSSSKQVNKVNKVEKKRHEELEAAAVLDEYIADFQTSAAAGKAFVRAGIIDPNKSIAIEPKLAPEEESYDTSRLYKPKSKMAELAEEFKKSKEITEEYKTSKLDLSKKKTGEKRKSNLELFKEELERSQKERDIRRKLKKGDLSGISEEMLNALPPTFFKPKTTEDIDEMNYQYEGGSKDNGDPTTTNLFVSNLNPKMNEEQLCKIFGKYGPLASVKIMWPRTEDEKSRNRNCGFVAFMVRKDGEKCLADIEGKDVMDYEMKIGWGKCVPIPPMPIYIHPSHSTAVRPPKQSGLPFNCQLSYSLRKSGVEFDGNLENTVVKVVIPTERLVVSLINRVVEFVVREGPMFEAMIMNREISNPMFRFLFDNKSNEHIYYRWRVFSLLQGDTTHLWQQKCFRMFKGGSLWQPPLMNPFAPTNISGLTASASLASVSSANVHSLVKGDTSPTLAMKKNMLLEHLLSKSEAEDKPVEKKVLSDRQRDNLEDLLRTVSTNRSKIGELMLWAIDHAEYSDEIVECICESLSILETPLSTKVARLFVVSDILHNSSAKVRNASSFRKAFQGELLVVMENMHKALTTCSTKSQAEKFRKQVLSCLAAWQDWSIYPPGFLINLQNVFVGISTAESVKKEESQLHNNALKTNDVVDDDLDGEPLPDDIDGVPLSKGDQDIDGIAVDDIDGLPLTKEGGSRWENDAGNTTQWGKDDPLSSSRWARVDNEDDAKPATNSNKWEKVEGVKLGKSHSEEDFENKTTINSGDNNITKRSVTPTLDNDEERRKFLRDVEVKVMRFVDKLEQRGGNRSGLNIQKEAAKFRKQLITEYEESLSREQKRNRKREQRSISPESSESRKRKRRKSSSSGTSDSESTGSENLDASRNGRRLSRSRSPRLSPSRKRSFSRSPRPRSPIFSDRSKSPSSRSLSRRSSSFSESPQRRNTNRSVSPRSRGRSPTSKFDRSSSPQNYSPKRIASAVTKSAKKKKSKKKR
ncbi:U2 snRNP-associated SURP motif-containing protein isoform X1 [Hydra vulgaris]|uniref:U2 snRNP-associated SURP motif-containing protein n=1 Tax=Hydra vulgaris TaxID=6087 RepID=T2MJI0_HYDVU|nr:U2 snRNP-associated SURP motif-containing protein [Hydra vulgaris]